MLTMGNTMTNRQNSHDGADEDPTSFLITNDVTKKDCKDFIDGVQIGSVVTVTPPKASNELTSRMHCAIRCIAKQVKWAGEKLSEEDWKRLFVAAHFGQRVLPSIDGQGFVVLDRRTGRMSGRQKFDLVEYVYAWGSERGVVFDDPPPQQE